MAEKYTAEQLNKLDKSFLIQLFLNQQEQVGQLTKEVHSLNEKIQKILEQLVLEKKERFGRSSEKMEDPGQLRFLEVDGNLVFFNEAEAVCDPSAPEPEDLALPKPRGKKTKGKREADLSGIETRPVDHYMSEEELVREFGENGWKQLPDVITKKYLFTPAKVTVEEHHIGVYSSKKDNHMVKASHPNWLLKSSPVSASLGAAIMNGKYVNAVPLYRLEKEFERYGLNITRQNMANWMIRLGEEYLGILYDQLHLKLYDYHVIQADETPLLVNRDGRPANSQSYMWVYRTGSMYEHPIVLYEYQKTRNASHPRQFLEDYSGICVTDGYQVYHTLEKEKEDLKIAGCWVHMRRKFNDALELISKEARKGTVAYLAMKQIQAVYREEGKLKDLSSEERLRQRQLVVKPLVDAFFVYLKQNAAAISPKMKLGEAIGYALNQEKYLRVFLEDGDVPMDNNASERAIRGFCIGKKNWVMIDTINGAKSSAIIYSIAETAKANNLKPYEYFEYLLTEIPKHMDENSKDRGLFLERMMPWFPDLPEHIRKPKKAVVKA